MFDLDHIKQEPSSFLKQQAESVGQGLLRVDLTQPLSHAVVEDKVPGIKQGIYTLGFGDSMKVLGKTFYAVIGPWRPHAVLTVGKSLEKESFDPTSTAWKEIEARLGTKVEGEGPKTGADFLLYLPERDSFAYFFFAKTARDAIPDAEALMGKLAKFEVYLVETAKYKWFKPKVLPAEPEAVARFSQAVDKERLETAVKTFRNPLGEGTSEAKATEAPAFER